MAEGGSGLFRAPNRHLESRLDRSERNRLTLRRSPAKVGGDVPILKVGVFMGGQSAEHQVSLLSGRAVLRHLKREDFDPLAVVVGPDGVWRWQDNEDATVCSSMGRFLLEARIDVALIMLHGPYGEDGTLQGFFETAGIPYVGAGVKASALAMDKALFKNVMRAAKIPVLDYREVWRRPWSENREEALEVLKTVGFPLMVKPSSLGSSIGISKVDREEALEQACEAAFQFDECVIVEEYVAAREIECGVIGARGDLRPLAISEIIPKKEFYDYEAKYTPGLTEIVVPAKVLPEIAEKAQALSLQACQAIGCEGLARVDLFLQNTEVFVNEINTIPGFTETSVYPRMAAAKGMSFSQLLSELIKLALLARGEKRSLIRATREYLETL